jgi:hypothetical protein
LPANTISFAPDSICTAIPHDSGSMPLVSIADLKAVQGCEGRDETATRLRRNEDPVNNKMSFRTKGRRL